MAAPRTTRRCPNGAKERSSNLKQVRSSMRAMVDLTTCLSNGSICWKVKGMIPSCHRNQGLSKWPPPSTEVPNRKRAERNISLVHRQLPRVDWWQTLRTNFSRTPKPKTKASVAVKGDQRAGLYCLRPRQLPPIHESLCRVNLPREKNPTETLLQLNILSVRYMGE